MQASHRLGVLVDRAGTLHHHRTGGRAIVIGEIDRAVELKSIAGLPAHLTTQSRVVDVTVGADHAVAAGGAEDGHTAGGEAATIVTTLDVAALTLADTGDAHEQRVGHRKVGAGAQINAIARTIGTGHIATVTGGLLGVQLDRTTDRVLAGQSALRAAQNFDTLEVQQVHDRAGQRGVINVIDIDADAGLECGVEVELTDTADRCAHGRAIGCALGLEGDVRCLVSDFTEVGLVARLQQITGDGGDGQRRGLHALLAELRRDDDFFQCIDGAGRCGGAGCNSSRHG